MAECTAREWRVRWAADELRRAGVRVRLDRILPGAAAGDCAFVFEAASARDVVQVAELAELGEVAVVLESRAEAV